jgi:glucose/arabinose dehydrogenase
VRSHSFRWLARAVLLLISSPVFASFHLMEVSEVMTGVNGDTSIQFIELRMQAPGQNFVDGLTIVARNADGSVANTVFTFPTGASTQLVNAVTDGRILIATPAFAARAGILPDFVFAGGLFPVSGQVDYASGTATAAYGSYTGPGIVGADAISAPGNDLRSLTRIANTSNDFADFALQPNAPQNNSGQIGHITASYSVPLRITEVNPLTGQAEVTNVDVTTFTSAINYYFSFRTSNVSLITTGTVFAPGESKLYTLPGLDPADSDLWLYKDSNFSDPLSVLSGLKYGPAAGVGQVAVAVAGGIWPNTSAFVVATTQSADSLRLIAYDGTRPENWAGGAPNPGSFFGTGTIIGNPIVSGIPKGTVSVEFQVLVSGLAAPLGIAEPDDGSNRMFVYDQAGTVTLLLNGVKQATPFLDVTSRLVPLGLFPPLNYDERGLLGFAMHPNFAANPKVYTYTSEPATGTSDFTTSRPAGGFDHQDVLAEWTVDLGNPNIINPASRRELFRNDHPEFNHNGGTLRFGPDGKLYVSIGDGGAGDDQGEGHEPTGNAQDTFKVLGKVLRIDPDGNNSANGKYGVPVDNPFVGGGGLGEIWAYGFRNPYTYHFDSATGLLYLGDAGQNKIEEVDIVTKGLNYGWRFKEGGFFFDPQTPAGGDGQVTTIPVVPVPLSVVNPLVQYDHDEGIVVIGGAVYRGTGLPALSGRYVFGDFSSGFGVPNGRLFYVNASGQINEFIIGATDRPLGLFLKAFAQDRNGNVYVCGSSVLGPFGTTGKVLKLVPIGAAAASDWQHFE